MYTNLKLALVVAALLTPTTLRAAKTLTLNADTWQANVPQGKEVDCIYGDHLLSSDRLIAVVAQATKTRHANMTVKGVGGALIDLTQRETPSDQLSCFYPLGGGYRLEGPVDWPTELPAEAGAATLAFTAKLTNPRADAAPTCSFTVAYELLDGRDYLSIYTIAHNGNDDPASVSFMDAVRADGEFKFGMHQPLGLWWCEDEYWKQAYGVTAEQNWTIAAQGEGRDRQKIHYRRDGEDQVTLQPDESVVLERLVYAQPSSLQLHSLLAANMSEPTAEITFQVTDPQGPVADAIVRLQSSDTGEPLATGHTDESGAVRANIVPGSYQVQVESQGRTATAALQGDGTIVVDLSLPALGKMAGQITDETGTGTPCRIAFFGQGVADPHFGPDTAIHGVRNLWHTHDGNFEVELLPGDYELVISRGPEYDAIFETVTVAANETTRLQRQLVRSVDTTGWLSAELHSHSSPSGDNTSSQRGRVLNLLVDHLEFIPCTEHQRISTYDAHLEAFNAVDRVITCAGMELTGSLLAINHQNAFPLVEHLHHQDGGAPVVHPNPEFQIERLAMWDDGSDKVVQINHPDIAQLVGDRDKDGTPDAGFARMLHFADVIEVHPPELIFAPLEVGEGGWDGRGTVILNWMQLLNQGHRIPGVVNTDAHWNFYGSGWLRNYIRSSTDDPGQANLEELCHALEQGKIVMTNGPFLEVKASAENGSAGPGEDLTASNGSVQLNIKVQCPNWLDVNRVQIFINGRADEQQNFTRRTHGNKFSNDVVKFQQTIPIQLNEDAHVVVATAAEGRTLGRVYGPEQGATMPVAVSNPIFVDIDANGFQPNGDTLGIPLPMQPPPPTNPTSSPQQNTNTLPKGGSDAQRPGRATRPHKLTKHKSFTRRRESSCQSAGLQNTESRDECRGFVA